MKMKIYAPNGTELKIHSKKLNECPFCHELSLIERYNNDEEGVDLICVKCGLRYTAFSLRKFIKLKGFNKELSYENLE